MTDCEHQYRRDVETCPYCELNEAEQELDEARTTIEDLRRLVSVKEMARDEARGVARRLLEEGPFHIGAVLEYEEAYPWLAEEAGRE